MWKTTKISKKLNVTFFKVIFYKLQQSFSEYIRYMAKLWP